MKPAPFSYHDPNSSEEALALLAEHGDEGKLLAGGQSLVPLLNFRLARPEHLIDINRVGSLAGIRRRYGVLRIGAMTRQAALERSALVAEHWPLLSEATRQVAHAQIRNRGTVGGSVAHADPAAELPVALAALDARFHVRSTRAARTLDADDLFVAQLMTTIEPDELLTEIEVPPLAERTGHAFVEFARRHGDFALGGAAVLLSMNEFGVCERARIVLLAAGPKPLRASAAEQVLAGGEVDEAAARAAAERAIEEIQPTGDIHGSSGYRRDRIGVMARRAFLLAARRAVGEADGDGASSNERGGA
ncbi:MAG: FAD binding domain-containing protein [Solirubrobacterales bacterium]